MIDDPEAAGSRLPGRHARLGRRLGPQLDRRSARTSCRSPSMHQHRARRLQRPVPRRGPRRRLRAAAEPPAPRNEETPMRIATWNINGVKARQGVLLDTG